MFGNSRQHARANLFAVMKREHEIGPTGTTKRAVGTALALHFPAMRQQRAEQSSCFNRGPSAHESDLVLSRHRQKRQRDID